MKSSVLLFIIASITSLNIFSQNWQTIGGNNQRNGQSEITGPANVITSYWQVNSANVSLWGNSVFTYNDKFVTARVTFSPYYKSIIEFRNINNGSLIWQKQINDSSIMYAVGFTEDAVYAHDYKTGILYALNVNNGSVKWSTLSYMFPGNTGLLYACDGDPIDKGRRINKTNGQAKWTNNYIIPVGPDGGFCVYSNTYYHWTGSIVTPKQLIAIDINTGVTKYLSQALPGDGDQENDLCIGPTGTIYIARDGGALYAFNDNGTAFVLLWSNPNRVIIKGVGKDGYLYGSNTGSTRIVRLNPANGNIVDSAQTLIPLGYMAVGADSTIYISTGEAGNGRYAALTPDLQTIKWMLSIPYNYYSGPSLSRDGIFIIVGSGTEIRAYKTNAVLKPVADFRASRTILMANADTMTLFDQSSFSPTSWSWAIPGSNTPVSTQQNPSNISYTTAGIYPVTLTAFNSQGNDTLVKTCYITVTPFIGIKQITGEVPTVYKLYQNYPNPFNPTTKIRFSIPQAGAQYPPKGGQVIEPVQLKVYDILGCEIVILFNEQLQTGSYEVDWNAENYPNGVYYYKLTTGHFSETKKMILIK